MYWLLTRISNFNEGNMAIKYRIGKSEWGLSDEFVLIVQMNILRQLFFVILI